MFSDVAAGAMGSMNPTIHLLHEVRPKAILNLCDPEAPIRRFCLAFLLTNIGDYPDPRSRREAELGKKHTMPDALAEVCVE